MNMLPLQATGSKCPWGPWETLLPTFQFSPRNVGSLGYLSISSLPFPSSLGWALLLGINSQLFCLNPKVLSMLPQLENTFRQRHTRSCPYGQELSAEDLWGGPKGYCYWLASPGSRLWHEAHCAGCYLMSAFGIKTMNEKKGKQH